MAKITIDNLSTYDLNPLITGTILVNKTQDINGGVGDIAKQSITFTVNGATTIASTGTF